MNVDWTTLPDILWYSICEYLPDLIDIIHLSYTNHYFYNLLQENSFWRHLIRIRYGSKFLERYCNKIFSNENSCEYLYSSNEHLLDFE